MSKSSALLPLVLVAMLGSACRPAPPLPELYDVPPFALTNQAAQPFGLADLEGKVWIANFIFTSCPEICPRMTAQMKGIHTELSSEVSRVSFVSISVDPATDTPARLTEYAKRHGALVPNWFFLTGESDDIRKTVVDGFKQAFEENPENPADIFHGSHFVLVDGRGSIRGYYASSHQDELEKLVVDVGRLLDSDS